MALPSEKGADDKNVIFLSSAQNGCWECIFPVISAKRLVEMYFFCDQPKTGGMALAWEQDGKIQAENATMR